MDQPGEQKSQDSDGQGQQGPHRIQSVKRGAVNNAAVKEMVELSGIEPLTS